MGADFLNVSLDPNEAEMLYWQLFNGMLHAEPNAILQTHIPNPVYLATNTGTLPLYIDTQEASQFMEAMELTPNRPNYPLQFHAPALPELDNLQKFFAQDIPVQQLFTHFTSGRTYLAEVYLDAKDLRAMDTIARTLNSLHGKTPLQEEGIRFLADALVLAHRYHLLPQVADAFYNMCNLRRTYAAKVLDYGQTYYDMKDPDGTSHRMDRYYQAYDLASTTLMMVAMVDYEQHLTELPHYEKLPDFLVKLPQLKEFIFSGKLTAIYEPPAVTALAAAIYDGNHNQIVSSELLFKNNFFEVHEIIGGSSAQMMVHELIHAWFDYQRGLAGTSDAIKSLSRKKEEAIATTGDVAYVAMREGLAYTQWLFHKIDYNLYVNEHGERSSFLDNIQKYAGFDLATALPREQHRVRLAALGLINALWQQLSQLQEQLTLENIDWAAVTEAWVTLFALHDIDGYTHAELEMAAWPGVERGDSFQINYITEDNGVFSLKSKMISLATVNSRQEFSNLLEQSLDYLHSMQNLIATLPASDAKRTLLQDEIFLFAPKIRMMIRFYFLVSTIMRQKVQEAMDQLPANDPMRNQISIAAQFVIEDPKKYFLERVLPVLKLPYSFSSSTIGTNGIGNNIINLK